MIEVVLTPNSPRQANFTVPGTDHRVYLSENHGATLMSDSQGYLGELDAKELSRLIIARSAKDYSEIEKMISEVEEMLRD